MAAMKQKIYALEEFRPTEGSFLESLIQAGWLVVRDRMRPDLCIGAVRRKSRSQYDWQVWGERVKTTSGRKKAPEVLRHGTTGKLTNAVWCVQSQSAHCAIERAEQKQEDTKAASG